MLYYASMSAPDANHFQNIAKMIIRLETVRISSPSVSFFAAPRVGGGGGVAKAGGSSVARATGILIVVGLFLSGFPVQPTYAQIPGTGCHVLPGMSIQSALDAASTNSHIVVCAGIYRESLHVTTSSIILEGQPGAIIDGSTFLGTTHGVRIGSGVSDFSLMGFEIREFDDTFSSTDLSSGIISSGSAKRIRIVDNYIHGNAWAGIAFGGDGSSEWTVSRNLFATNGFAHILSHDTRRLLVEENEFGTAPYAALLGYAQKATVARNLFQGDGDAAIVALPALDLSGWSFLVSIHNNTISGSYGHGIWALALQRSTIRDNLIISDGQGIVLGGDPEQIVMGANYAPSIVETKEIRDALQDLAEATGGTWPQTIATTVEGCSIIMCFLARLAGLVERALPSASAQAPPPPLPPPCSLLPEACDPFLVNLIEQLLFTSMNPMATPSDQDDFARLQACAGLTDACLLTEFIDSADGSPHNGWSLSIVDDPIVGTGELRFVAAAVRRQTETKGWKSIVDELGQNWTTLVLCRFYTDGIATNCASVPRLFDFGLDVTHADSEYANYLSMWRAKLPTNITHATFDRIHGTDATLFKHTSYPHHSESPPVSGAVELPEPPLVQDVLRTEYAGTATLQCNIVVPSVVTTPPNVAQGYDCESPTLIHDLESIETWWCSASLDTVLLVPSLSETIHSTKAAEMASGLWDWSPTCAQLDQPYTSNWTTFYGDEDIADLAEAQADYYVATTNAAREVARANAENVTLRVVARHLALQFEGLGLPLIVPEDQNASSQHDSVALEWRSRANANLHIETTAVEDQGQWSELETGALVAFTPTNFTVNVRFRSLNGDLYDLNLEFWIGDENISFVASPLIVNRMGQRLGTIATWDPDNLDYDNGFALNSTRVHGFPLVTVKSGGKKIGAGLFEAGFRLPDSATSIAPCARELWTGKSIGTSSNLLDLNRLAIQTDSNKVCDLFDDLDEINLRFFHDLSISVEVREGASPFYRAEYEDFRLNYDLTMEPYVHPVSKVAPFARPTLLQAFQAYSPTPQEKADETGQIRLIVETPELSSAERAQFLADLLTGLQGTVGVVAVEWEHVPLTPILERAINNAVNNFGLVVLVPAGSLPPGAWNLPVQDKLMTIHGLAASPHVITVGAAVPRGNWLLHSPLGEATPLKVAPWSRLGPTPAQLTPKPDFLAPAPDGSTIGAVANVLPFVVALASLGVRSPAVIRAILSSFALPAVSENGTPATFWEQGFGALDLSAYIDLPIDIPGLINDTAVLVNRTAADVREAASEALNITQEALNQTSPAAVLGAVAPFTALLRGAIGKTLLNLTVDSPALPANSAVDFGVVNREQPGTARFAPLEIDSILNATFSHISELLGVPSGFVRQLLNESGLDETELDEVMEWLLGLIKLSAQTGQNVTLNATHYYFADTLQGDFLYSAYSKLLQTAAIDTNPLVPVNQSSIDDVIDVMRPWLLKPYNLTDNNTGKSKLPVSLDCGLISPQGLRRMVAAIEEVWVNQRDSLQFTPKASPAAKLGNFVEPGVYDFVQSQLNQLVCLEDVLALLDYLNGRVLALRELKALPWGALNETEAWSGRWDQTLLGGQINETVQLLGFSPWQVAGNNSTIVLDAVIVLIANAIDMVRNLVSQLRQTNVVVAWPEGPQTLSTNTTRTSASPLGLYVGLALMTSHNVTVRNPFTGTPLLDPVLPEIVVTRNVTIPVPSVLWNNPTLVVDAAYRDTSPIAGATTMMYEPKPRVFGSSSENHNVIKNGVTVPLVVGPVELLVYEKESVIVALGVVDATLADFACESPIGFFRNDFCQGLFEYRDELMGRLAILLDVINDPIESIIVDPELLAAPIFESMTERLVSRMSFQKGVTNHTGMVALPNLFPGQYRLMMPYSYPMLSQMNLDYDYASPGGGGLSGPMFDSDREIGQFVQGFENSLLSHPSSFPLRPDEGIPEELVAATAACNANNVLTSCDYFPWFELNGQRYPDFFHQFGLNVDGPDLVGVSCVFALKFAVETMVPISFPGCGQIRLSNSRAVGLLHDLDEFARCLMGESGTDLGREASAGCLAFRLRVQAAHAACPNPFLMGANMTACVEVRSAQKIVNAVQNLSLAIGQIGGGMESLFLPWFHSPARVLLDGPVDYGMSVEGLHDIARALDANNGFTDAQIDQAIEDAIEDLPLLVNDTFEVIPPANESMFNVTHPQAILHHVTDRVSGLDWFHLDASIGEVVSSEIDPIGQVEKALNMVGGTGTVTGSVVDGYLEDLNTLTDAPARRLAYNGGLAENLTRKAGFLAGGWVPSGTVAPEGLALPNIMNPDDSVEIPDVCERASILKALPTPYFDCPEVNGARDVVDLKGLGGVDNVQFANALVDQIRNTPDYAGDEAKILRILNNSAALSSTEGTQGWNRTTDSIRMEAVNNTLAVGLMVYSVPVPVQEYFQMRLDAEILTQNTGILMITTSNEQIVEGVLGAVDNLSKIDIFDLIEGIPRLAENGPGIVDELGRAQNSTLAVISRVAESIDAVRNGTDQLLEGGDPVLQVELLGLPIKVGGFPASIGKYKPGVGLTHHCIACGGHIVVVQPDGHHVLRKTREFETKHLWEESMGVKRLYFLMVYFPTFVGDDAEPVKQKLMVSNFTVQLNTFLGMPNNDGRDVQTFALDFPIRYRQNIEDWKMLYAVPDQKPWNATLSPDGSLNATFELGTKNVSATTENVIRPLTVRKFKSKCPDTVAPGYDTERFAVTPRGLPAEPGDMFVSGHSVCDTDQIVAFNPQHVQGPPIDYWTTRTPKKDVLDSMGYGSGPVLPTGESLIGEMFIKGDSRVDRVFICARLCKGGLYPLSSDVGDLVGTLLPQSVGGIVGRLGAITALDDATGVVDATLDALGPGVDDSLLCIDPTNPAICIYYSFLPGAQHGTGGAAFAIHELEATTPTTTLNWDNASSIEGQPDDVYAETSNEDNWIQTNFEDRELGELGIAGVYVRIDGMITNHVDDTFTITPMRGQTSGTAGSIEVAAGKNHLLYDITDLRPGGGDWQQSDLPDAGVKIVGDLPIGAQSGTRDGVWKVDSVALVVVLRLFPDGNPWARFDVGGLPVHNYVVLDEEDARILMSDDPWDSEQIVQASDSSDAEKAATVFRPSANAFQSQKMETLTDTEYSTLVVADKYAIQAKQVADEGEVKQVFVENVDFFIGHSVSGTGLALSVSAIQAEAISDSDPDKFLSGLGSKSFSGIQIGVFKLGGPLTAGNNCGGVPLYGYVHDYFRCNGYTYAATGLELKAKADPSPCVERAEEFVAIAQGNTIDAAKNSSNEFFYFAEPVDDFLRAAAGDEDAPTHSVDEPANRAGDLANRTADNARMTAMAALLLTCISQKHNDVVPWLSTDVVADLFASTAGAVSDASHGDVVEAAKKITTHVGLLFPELEETGEPAHFVRTILLVHDQLRQNLSIPKVGPVAFNYTIEEWSSRVDSGSLRLKVTGPGVSTDNEIASFANASGNPISTMAPLPVANAYGAAAEANGKVYMFGGANAAGWSKKIVVFDPANNTTTTLTAQLPVAMYGASAVWDGDTYIYILGGCRTDGCASRGVLRFRPTTGVLVDLGNKLYNPRMLTGAAWNEVAQEVLLMGGRVCSTCSGTQTIVTFRPAGAGSSQYEGRVPGLHSPATVHRGNTAYLLGGCFAAECPASRIVRVDLQARQGSTLSYRLPTALQNAAAAWLGEDIYVFGGKPFTDDIVRVTPPAGRAIVMNATIGMPRAGAVAAAGTASVYVLGGQNQTTTDNTVLEYDPLHDPRDTSFLQVGPQGGFVTVTLLHNHTIELNLTVEDAYGNEASDKVTLTSDVKLPTIVTNLTSALFAKSSYPLQWTVRDPVSGLYDVHAEKKVGTGPWQSFGAPLASWSVGTKNPVTISGSLPASDFTVDGKVIQLRLVVADRAGNKNQTLHAITIDINPPELVRSIAALVNGIVTVPFLNTTVQASDAVSGLATLRIVVHNMSSGADVELYENNALNGTLATGEISNSTDAWLDTAYELRVVATDRSGRSASATLAATFHPLPKLSVTIPALGNQMVGYLKINSTATVKGFPDEGIDYALIKISNATSDVLSVNVTGESGTTNVTADWNTTGLAAGTYTIGIEAFREGVSTAVTKTGVVQAATSGYVTLVEGLRYDFIWTNGHSHLYRLVVAPCMSGFHLVLESIEGGEADLKVQEANPVGLVPAGQDPKMNSNWEDVSEDYHRANQLPGDVYSVLVAHQSEEVFYGLTYTAEGQVCVIA